MGSVYSFPGRPDSGQDDESYLTPSGFAEYVLQVSADKALRSQRSFPPRTAESVRRVAEISAQSVLRWPAAPRDRVISTVMSRIDAQDIQTFGGLGVTNTIVAGYVGAANRMDLRPEADVTLQGGQTVGEIPSSLHVLDTYRQPRRQSGFLITDMDRQGEK